MSRKHPIQGQSVLLHRMLFKVANEASAALFIARLFAVWILQRSRLLPALGMGLPPLPSISQPIPVPGPSLSQWQEEKQSKDLTAPVAMRIKHPVGSTALRT